MKFKLRFLYAVGCSNAEHLLNNVPKQKLNVLRKTRGIFRKKSVII